MLQKLELNDTLFTCLRYHPLASPSHIYTYIPCPVLSSFSTYTYTYISKPSCYMHVYIYISLLVIPLTSSRDPYDPYDPYSLSQGEIGVSGVPEDQSQECARVDHHPPQTRLPGPPRGSVYIYPCALTCWAGPYRSLVTTLYTHTFYCVYMCFLACILYLG